MAAVLKPDYLANEQIRVLRGSFNGPEMDASIIDSSRFDPTSTTLRTSRDAASLLSQSTTAVRPSTGPLAPLPRHSVDWKTFKLALAPGHRQTRAA